MHSFDTSSTDLECLNAFDLIYLFFSVETSMKDKSATIIDNDNKKVDSIADGDSQDVVVTPLLHRHTAGTAHLLVHTSLCLDNNYLETSIMNP